ncbi:hypothetical protein EXS74_00435 [Candidatus Woesearchaeota archaeon]|nr:hypothetical protein [Candidatus Woesearchaeota archaeon]
MTNRILELKERVFEYVQSHGPILPSVIAKEFRSTNIFISALLSELITNKRIKLSRAKIGGSPLYYCKEQEAKLVDLLRGNLGQKPREALDILKEKKVLRDRDCLPFERVALRELEDFAMPVKLVIHDTEEIFWKWYLLPDPEAKELIERSLERIYAPKKEEAVVQVSKVLEQIPEIEKEESVMIETKTPERIEKPLEKEKKKKKKFLQEVLVDKGKKEKAVEEDRDDSFESIVIQYLKKKEIKIVDKVVIAKNKELNFTVQIPTPVGELCYFVKARHKKSLSEGDLLLAFTEGQNIKLPTLYLSTGESTKKAKEYMTKNLKGMNFIKIK